MFSENDASYLTLLSLKHAYMLKKNQTSLLICTKDKNIQFSMFLMADLLLKMKKISAVSLATFLHMTRAYLVFCFSCQIYVK